MEFRCESPEQRETIAEQLREQGIGCGFHYPVPIHKQPAYRDFNSLCFPTAESLAEKLISLPMHPLLSSNDVRRVCEHVLQVCERKTQAA